MMHETRRKQTTKEDQQFSAMQPHHHGSRIRTHGGGGGGGSSGKEAHRYTQHQIISRLPAAGAPMAPLSDKPAAEASSASADDDGSTGGSSCWVKPGCMMELARLEKIPRPASGLTCPRCRSTQTKFCYYNYSLSQPRHFCKTCRRYWTHGGALRDLISFSSSVRRRRRNKPSNNKQASSKVPCCGGASGSTGRSPSSSSSGAAIFSGRVATATAILHPLENLLIGGAEYHRAAGASRRLWFPAGHQSSQPQDPVPLGYRHQLGNRGAATTIRLEHQRYLPQRQTFSLLGYKNAGTAAATSAIRPFSSGGGGTEAANSFARQMHAAISTARGSSAAVTTTELASESEMMAENTPISPTEMMGTLTTMTSSLGEFQVGVQGDHDLFHFLGSGSWACGNGSTAGNGSSGGTSSTVVAPGSAWPDTSSSSGRSTIL